MHKKLVFLILSLVLILMSSANAKTIIWVCMNQDGDGDGNVLNDFQEFTDGLKAEGYTVDINPGHWNTLTPALVDELNKADLVLFSRSIQSGTFSTATLNPLWNGVTAPMLLASPYVLRKGRWNWVLDDTTIPYNAGDQGCPQMDVLIPSHPIFWGVTLDALNQLAFADPKLASGNCSFAPTNAVGNGTMIAKTVPTSLVQDWAWIVEWQKGQEFYTGSGTFAGSHRLFLSAGAHETAGNGNTRNKWSGYNLTSEGWKLYLNAVKYMLGELDPKKATGPGPKNGAKDISRDQVLSWTAGMYANTHNVFFGTDFNDVNEATVENPRGTAVYSALDVTSIDLGRLDYGTTYYWRVDEVNSPSKPFTYKGYIWSFSTELGGYAIPKTSIIDVNATGEPAYPGEQEPNYTCNGKGLDGNDIHTDKYPDMWLVSADGPGIAWIQYEFDKAYKLYDMLVWNYNEESPGQGFGVQDANVAYSMDGETWTALPLQKFNEATGDNTCKANTDVKFNGATAKFVRITFLTSFEGSDVYGLSEVRFMAEPTRAQTPTPASGSTTRQAVDVNLKWKAGRYSVQHYVYISIDANDVNNVPGHSVDPIIVSDPNVIPGLDLNKKYYWRVDEVNTANAYSTWTGPTWNLLTVQTLVLDNFEKGYGNNPDTNAVWVTWIDGVSSASNGSTIGSGDAPGLSTTIYHGSSGKSAPVYYDNSVTAETDSFVTAQSINLQRKTANWSIGHPTTLTIWFRGDSTNTIGDDELYCTIGGKTVVFGGNFKALIGLADWKQWDIDLVALGVNLSNIPDIRIGIRKVGATGGKGVIYLDDIQLSGIAPATPLEEVWIEAESGTLVEPYVTANTLTGASAGQYMGKPDGAGDSLADSPDPNTVATYTFTVTGGVYRIDVRIRTVGTEANGDSCFVKIPTATAIKTPAGVDTVLTTKGWVNSNSLVSSTSAWVWDTILDGTNDVYWTLPAGTNTLKISNREDGLMIDVIDIVKIRN